MKSNLNPEHLQNLEEIIYKLLKNTSHPDYFFEVFDRHLDNFLSELTGDHTQTEKQDKETDPEHHDDAIKDNEQDSPEKKAAPAGKYKTVKLVDHLDELPVFKGLQGNGLLRTMLLNEAILPPLSLRLPEDDEKMR